MCTNLFDNFFPARKAVESSRGGDARIPHAIECPRFPFMRAAYLRFCAHSVHFLAPMTHIFSTRRNDVLCPR